MNINRIKYLSGIKASNKKAPTSVTKVFENIKLSKELQFKSLTKIHEASCVDFRYDGINTVASVVFEGATIEESKLKLQKFMEDWKLLATNRAILEGHKLYPVIDSEEFPPIKGLEGPFRYESGKVLYYSPKLGKYYDSKTDTYLSAEDVEYHRTPRSMAESEEILEEKMTAAQKAKREEIVLAMKKDADKMKEKYGDDWEKVMYATATKQALKEGFEKESFDREGFYDDIEIVKRTNDFAGNGTPWFIVKADGGELGNVGIDANSGKWTYLDHNGYGPHQNERYANREQAIHALLDRHTGVDGFNEEKEEKEAKLDDACWDGYEAIGTKKKNGKTVPNCVPVNEDHGKGYYVMVDGKEHCWCETRKEAEEKQAKLKSDGKKATIVADKDIKESHCDEKDQDHKEDAAEKTKEKSEKKDEDKDEEQVKEAIVDNFVQDDADKDNTVAKRTGTDAMMNTVIKVPAKVKDAVNARIAELKKSIEIYDEKGYNDHSQKEKAIECLQQIMDNLSYNNLEGLKKAQIYFSTLMSPITELFPSHLIHFLANAQAIKEQEDKDRASVLKRHIAHHEEYMNGFEKDSTSYKDHKKALERYKKELAQYE